MRSSTGSTRPRSCSMPRARISRSGSCADLVPRSTSETCRPTRCWPWRRFGSVCGRTRWAWAVVAAADARTGGGVLLARHGETDDNREPLRFQGWRDTPLNDTGRRQATELAERMADEAPGGLWSSDLRRARETAEIVGRRLGLQVRLDRRLREAYRGRWEGRSRLALSRRRVPARAAGARAGLRGRHPNLRASATARRVSRRLDTRCPVRIRRAGARRVSHLPCSQRFRGDGVTRLPVVAFVALVAATVAAFFITQHLKVATPLIAGYPSPVPAGINPVSGTRCYDPAVGKTLDYRMMRISFYLL